jgi:hypothetical protein
MKLFALRSAAWTTLALCLVFATSASATALGPGTSGLPSAEPMVGATLEASTGVMNFTVTNLATMTVTATGTVEENVYLDSLTGHLDFVIAAHNNIGSSDAPDRITTTDYTGFSTDVGVNAGVNLSPFNILGGLGTVTPTSVDRSISGGTVGFQLLPNAFFAGTDTVNLVIETNANGWNTLGSINFIDGGIGSVNGFSPLATPEPASYLLMGTGMLLCAFFLRRNMATSTAGVIIA